MKYSFEQRYALCENPMGKKLLQLMATKHTNLAVSADVTHKKDLLNLAERLGPEICILKTHIDILEDFDQQCIEQLQQIAKEHNFLLFEDRKFADIGNTVQLQYSKGIYHIADWADIINAHILPGPGIIDGLKAVANAKQRGLLLIGEMSSAGNYFNPTYIKQTVQLAQANRDFVCGFICQHRLTTDPGMLHISPGVQLETSQDNLGQKYRTPQQAILDQQVDIIIVGRGIYGSTDPLNTAKQYRQAAWNAYLQRHRNEA